MSILSILIKTIIIYILVAIIFRILGKREVGQLGTFDLVVFILIAELVALSLEEKGHFIIHLTPVIVLAVLQIVISKISIKSPKFRDLVDGRPTIIIKNGVINFKNMSDQRYSLDDLLLQLREKDVRNIDEIEYAILETNGKLSVFKKDDKDGGIYPLPIILDGYIQYDNLYGINKNKNWLINILDKKNTNLNNVFYAFYKKGILYIINKDEVRK